MIRWKLRQFLDEHGLSAYALTKQADLVPNTVYAMARGTPKQIQLETLDAVLKALEELVGKRVTFSDILERVPE